MSPSKFAKEIRCTPRQVTQYCNQGMAGARRTKGLNRWEIFDVDAAKAWAMKHGPRVRMRQVAKFRPAQSVATASSSPLDLMVASVVSLWSELNQIRDECGVPLELFERDFDLMVQTVLHWSIDFEAAISELPPKLLAHMKQGGYQIDDESQWLKVTGAMCRTAWDQSNGPASND